VAISPIAKVVDWRGNVEVLLLLILKGSRSSSLREMAEMESIIRTSWTPFERKMLRSSIRM